jgi:hypothetical protein
MAQDEKALLENVLDSLDRLFDHQSTVIDLFALLFATSKALVGSLFQPHIEPLAGRLLAIVRTQRDEESRRDAALVATDDLRKVLAGSLPKPTLKG